MRRLLAASAALAFAQACGGGSSEQPHGNGAPDPAAYPTHLARPSELPGAWSLEQEVTVAHAEGEHSFRAVLQKNGDELLLVGLAPHGARGFLLAQRGDAISYESYVSIELRFPPEYMLHDVHRMWLVPSDPPATDGEKTYDAHDEHVTERWAGGRLLERRFTRIDGRPEGAIVATYPGPGLAPDALSTTAPPDTAELDNGWFGYRLRVRTIRWTPIAGAAQP